ncbi:hypothetical protein Gotur_025113 [Gossypium turneri]
MMPMPCPRMVLHWLTYRYRCHISDMVLHGNHISHVTMVQPWSFPLIHHISLNEGTHSCVYNLLILVLYNIFHHFLLFPFTNISRT